MTTGLKNVIVYGLPRSGTSILYETIKSSYMIKLGFEGMHAMGEAFEGDKDHESIENIIDELNFKAGGNMPVVLNLHSDTLFNFTGNQLKRLISIIENRDFHVVKLVREDLNELILSYFIARTTKEWSGYSKKKFVGDYNVLKDTIPNMMEKWILHNENYLNLPIHQEITIEKFSEEKTIDINGFTCNIDDVKIGSQKNLRSPKKSDRLENYDEILEWYGELFDEYAELYL